MTRLVSGSLAVLIAALLAPRAHAAAAPDLESVAAAVAEDFRAGPIQAARAAAPWTNTERVIAEALNPGQLSFRFTRDQYLALRRSGRGLTLAPGQDWMPAAISANALEAVSFAFDNGMAQELSWKDFFHGHLELDKGTAVDDRFKRLEDARRAKASACDVCARYWDYKKGRNSSLPGAPAKSFQDFSADFFVGSCSVDEFKNLYVAQLQALAMSPNHHVIYHTRETFDDPGPPRQNRTLIVDARGRAAKDPAGHAGGDSETSEPAAGSLTVSFFVDGSGELVFYPAEDSFIILRTCMRLQNAEPPF